MKRLHLDLIHDSIFFIDTAGQAINHYHKEGAGNWIFLTHAAHYRDVSASMTINLRGLSLPPCRAFYF